MVFHIGCVYLKCQCYPRTSVLALGYAAWRSLFWNWYVSSSLCDYFRSGITLPKHSCWMIWITVNWFIPVFFELVCFPSGGFFVPSSLRCISSLSAHSQFSWCSCRLLVLKWKHPWYLCSLLACSKSLFGSPFYFLFSLQHIFLLSPQNDI